MKKRMGPRNKTSNKRLRDLCIIVLTICVEKILDVLFQIELPKVIFLFVVCYIIGKSFYFIYRQVVFAFRDYRKYRISSSELNAKFKKDKEKENEKNNIYVSYLRKRDRRVKLIIIYIVLAVVGIGALCALNPQNAKAMREGLKVFLEESNDNERAKGDKKNEEESVKSREQGDNDQEKGKEDYGAASSVNKKMETVGERQKKLVDYEFILLDAEKKPLVDTEVYEQVYFNKKEGNQKEDIPRLIEKFIRETLEIKRKSIDWDGFPNAIIRTPSVCEQMQKEFEKEISKYKKEIYLDEWELVAPTSGQLDEIMDARNYLNTIIVDGNQGNYFLWWRLANDNQRYAQQYEIQTNNKEAVFYYYTMSIYCCMESLKYDISEIEYDTIFNYMITRYEDIARDESIVDKEDKIAAKYIAEYLKDN